MAHDEEFIDLCAASALGNLEASDRSRLDAHLAKRCPDCEAALRDFGYGATLLAASAPLVLPAPEVKARVLEAIRELPAPVAAPEEVEEREPARNVPPERVARARDEKRSEPARARAVRAPRESGGRRSWIGWLGWVGWGVAALLAVTAGTLFESTGRLREIITTREREIGDLAKQLAVEQQWTGILSARGARVTEMTPPPGPSLEAQALRGRVIYDPGSRRALIVLENSLPPADQDYELWAIRREVPVSLGVAQADPRGTAVVRLDNAGDPASLSGFAVSLEPKGGSPTKNAPSGPFLLLGSLHE